MLFPGNMILASELLSRHWLLFYHNCLAVQSDDCTGETISGCDVPHWRGREHPRVVATRATQAAWFWPLSLLQATFSRAAVQTDSDGSSCCSSLLTVFLLQFLLQSHGLILKKKNKFWWYKGSVIQPWMLSWKRVTGSELQDKGSCWVPSSPSAHVEHPIFNRN